MNLSAKTQRNGFYYEFNESTVNPDDMHILRCKQSNNELTDFIWPNGALRVELEIKRTEKHNDFIEREQTEQEIIDENLADWCLDSIHEWEVKDEDYFN